MIPNNFDIIEMEIEGFTESANTRRALRDQYMDESKIKTFLQKRLQSPFEIDEKNQNFDQELFDQVIEQDSIARESYEKDYVPENLDNQDIFSPDQSQNINYSFENKKQGFSNNTWRGGALRILQFVVKFITIFLQTSEKFKFSNISKSQFKAINDKSAFYNFYLQNNLIIRKKKQTKLDLILIRIKNLRLIKYVEIMTNYVFTRFIRVMKPDTIEKFLWDSIIFSTLLINIFYVPLKVGFQLQNTIENLPHYYVIMEQIPGIILIFDILLSFNKGFYSHGVLNVSKKSIASHYVSQQFFSDLIVLIPFIAVKSQIFNIEYIDLVILLKFNKMRNIFEEIEEFLNLREKLSTEVDVGKLIFLFIFASHIFACAWHLIAVIENQYDLVPTWIDNANLNQRGKFSLYINSFYWSSITTLTIGYGDIIPKTDVEKLFVILVAITSSLIFGYTISSVGSIFSKISQSKTKNRDRISQLIGFTKTRGVSKDLQNRISKSYQYQCEVEQSQDKECVSMIESLSLNLKVEVKIELYKNLILASGFFRDTFTPQYSFLIFTSRFIEELCQKVKEKLYIPEEYIFQSGQRLQEVYFVNNLGQVQIFVDQYSSTDTHIIGQFKNSQIIGERLFITGQESNYSAKSTRFTNLACIEFLDFYNLLDKYPLEKEKFLEVRNKVLMKEYVKNVGCELCKMNHQIQECKFVFYNPKMRTVIKRHKQVIQERVPFVRNKFKREHSPQSQQIVKESIFSYGLENGYFLEDDINEAFIQKYDLCFLQEQSKKSQKSSEYPVQSKDDYELRGHHPSLLSIRLMNRQMNSVNPNPNQTTQQYRKISSTTSDINDAHEDDMEQKIQIINIDPVTNSASRFERNIFSFQQSYLASVKTQIYQDYVRLLKEDSLPELDKRKDYLNYYPLGNFQMILQSLQRLKIKRLIKGPGIRIRSKSNNILQSIIFKSKNHLKSDQKI